MTPNGDFQATLTEQRLFAVMPLTGPPGPPMGVQDEGSPLPAFNILNFTGAGVTAAGDAPGNRITITIPGAVAGLVDSVFTRTGAVIAQSGDYTAAQVTNAVSTLGSYADPAWITSLAWSKITGEPSSFPPDTHVHAAADTTSGVFAAVRLGSGTASAGTYLRGDSVWAAVSAGMTQTPWTSNIDGAGYTLNNVGQIRIGVNAGTSKLTFAGANANMLSRIAFFESDAGEYLRGAGMCNPATGVYGVAIWARELDAPTETNFTLFVRDNGEVNIGPWARAAALSVPTDGATDSGALVFSTRYLGAFGERMRISANGNVGIAKNAPTAPLEFATAVGDKIYLWATGGVGAFGFGVQSAELQIFTPGVNDVISLNPGRVQTLVAKEGKVGIGTAAPLTRLAVADQSRPYNDPAGGQATFTIAAPTGAINDDQLMMGVHIGDYAWIQAIAPGIAGRALWLNVMGGDVSIGAAASVIKVALGGSLKTLSVDGSGFVKAA